MLKNLSNALVRLHEFQKMEQLWISFSFFCQKICSKKLWRKPTVMPNRPEVAPNNMRRNACILRVECFVWNKVLAGNKNVLVERQLYWCSNHSKSNGEESL